MYICDKINCANIDLLKTIEEATDKGYINNNTLKNLNKSPNIISKSIERIYKLSYYYLCGIPIILEGPTGTSRSYLNKDIDFWKTITEIKNILKKSSFFIKINNTDNNQQDLIEFRDNIYNEEYINYNDFKNVLKNVVNKNFEYKDYFQLIDNYNKLIKFIEDIKKIIKNKFKNIELEIKLDIEEIEDKNKNYIKNILCKYNLIKPPLINIKSYSDSNILYLNKYDNLKFFLIHLEQLINK